CRARTLHSAPVLILSVFYCYGDHRDLHSFPTRRSSDLAEVIREAKLVTLVVQADQPARLAGRLRKAPGVEQVEPFGAALHVTGTDRDALTAALAAENVEARPAETSLEDVFIRMMDQSKDNMR